jgi:VanZ family protein
MRLTQLLHRHGFVYDQLPLFLWALLIFISSSIPDVTLPEFEIISSDKLAHLIIYIILSALLYRAIAYQDRFPKLARWSFGWTFIFAVAYGATDEFHQLFVPNRDASFLDLAADALGAFIFVMYGFLSARSKRNAT